MCKPQRLDVLSRRSGQECSWFFLPIAIVVHVAANCLAGLYGRVWRYASLVDVPDFQSLRVGFACARALLALNFSTARRMPTSLVILGAIVVSAFPKCACVCSPS